MPNPNRLFLSVDKTVQPLMILIITAHPLSTKVLLIFFDEFVYLYLQSHSLFIYLSVWSLFV